MKFLFKSFFAFCLLAFVFEAQATHYRAGEILYKLIGNFKYEVTVVTYSKFDGQSQLADRDRVWISWGDGTGDSVCRSNGPVNGSGCRDGVIVATTPISIKKSEYK